MDQGSSFVCVGVARELTLVKVFFQIVGEQGHTFGYLGRLDSGYIVHFIFLCTTKGCTQKLLFFVYIINRREGVIWI